MYRIATVLIVLGALAIAAPANANEYRVYSCKLPDGRPAPADGWTPAGSAPYAWFQDGCASGGSMSAGLAGDAQAANTSHVGWGFDSGPAEIERYSIVRSGRIYGHVTGASTLLYSSDAKNAAGGGYSVDYCAAYSGCGSITGTLERSGAQIPAGSRAWFFMVGCGGITGTYCVPAAGATEFGSLRIDSAVFTLRDDEQPQASGVGGSLSTPGASAGDLEFTATDGVSGVHRAAIELDGVEVESVLPNANGGRCETLGLAGAIHDFKYRRPCPARQAVELTLAPGAVAPGAHTLRARVYDAAGNGLTVLGPRTVVVGESQAGSVGAAGAAQIDSDSARSRTVTYGKLVAFSGTLRGSAGNPVAGAELAVEMTSRAAARRQLTRRVVTGADGRYEFSVKATASRAVALRHPASGASLTQSFTVRSRIALRAKRSRVRPLGRMHLTGRIPTATTRRGSSVAIKVRSGRSWRTVGVVRASTRGAFSFSYRFRRTRQGSLTFRAVALRSSDLAVSPRASNRVRIRVG